MRQLLDILRTRERLLEDLEGIDEDYRLAEQKINIEYAVDASEVRNYLYPFHQKTLMDFIFGMTGKDAYLYTDVCLNRLLFERRWEHVLLPQFSMEINTILDR